MSKEAPYTRGIPKDNWHSPFSAFNSMKYLMWREWMEAIVAMDYRWHPEQYKDYDKKIKKRILSYCSKYDNFLPPYMVDIDPSNICNYDIGTNTGCIWCNSRSFRHKYPKMLSTEHLLKIADFLKKWGVKSTCISGGGDPLTNPSFSKLLWRLYNNNIENGVICNGSLLDFEKAFAIVHTSNWCGFSIDAGRAETFAKVHGVEENIFNKVIDNLKMLIDMKRKFDSNIEITYKYLLHPLNASEIVETVQLAKDIGVNTFHLRPVCWDNLYNQKHDKPIDYKDTLDIINDQLEESQKLGGKDFNFFGIRHKFNPDFSRKVNFKRCLATPMMTTFGADGNVHICFDVRGCPEWVLCRHDPNPDEILKVWGSEKHKKIIDSIKINHCPRCTFSGLQEIIEEVIIKDKMFKDFL